MVEVFHRVRVKPGKPLLFGYRTDPDSGRKTLIFGLPGNPVAVIVCFLLFVVPALRALCPGLGDGLVKRSTGHLSKAFRHQGDRPTYHPSRFEATTDGRDHSGSLTPLDWAGSADLAALMSSDGFAVFPEGDHCYQPGDLVEFLHIGW